MKNYKVNRISIFLKSIYKPIIYFIKKFHSFIYLIVKISFLFKQIKCRDKFVKFLFNIMTCLQYF